MLGALLSALMLTEVKGHAGQVVGPIFGVLRHEQITRGAAKGVGNPVFYVGPATGRDTHRALDFGHAPERGDVAVFKYPGDQGQGADHPAPPPPAGAGRGGASSAVTAFMDAWRAPVAASRCKGKKE